jgi:hypothetical protein
VIDGRLRPGRRQRSLPEPVEGRQHRVEPRQDVGLHAPERRQPETRQLELEIAQVLLAQREVVDEVPRRRPVRHRHALDLLRVPSLALDRPLADRGERRDQAIEDLGGEAAGHGRRAECSGRAPVGKPAFVTRR